VVTSPDWCPPRLRRPIERILSLPPWTLYLLFAAILFLRYPQGIIHADFWGEDGAVWYREAYEIGWRSLLSQYTGYLQTTSRLVALLAQCFPLTWGPTIFASAALMIQALPPTLLVSRRMSDAWPDPVGRFCFALIYVALPNSMEVLTNLTNAQWHLACLAFLIVVIRPSANLAVAAAELIALAVAGLSGPFAVFLLPIAVWRFVEARRSPALVRTSLLRLGILTLCVGIQSSLLFSTMNATRLQTPLGADLPTLAHIIAIQIILGAMLGIRVLQRVSGHLDAILVPITLLGGFLGAVALYRGGRLPRQAFFFATLVLATALISPVVSLTEPQWPLLTHPGLGNRYFFIPMLLWIGILFTLVRHQATVIRGLAWGFLLLLPLGIVADFNYPGSKPTKFLELAREFEQAPPGTPMAFMVHPRGFPPMILVKH
jgi:hypothetical protein